MLRKFGILMLCVMMTTALTPACSFAADSDGLLTLTPMATEATDLKTAKDEKGNEWYTQIVLKPYTFYDVANGAKQRMEDTVLKQLVNDNLLNDWVEIANGVYKTAGKCATIDSDRYAKAFNNSSPNYNCFGDVRTFLKSEKTTGKVSRDNFSSTGLKVTNSLKDVRQTMADHIAARIDHKPCHADGILKQGPVPSGQQDGSVLDEMQTLDKDAPNKQVVYSIATSINEFTGCEYIYNSFGIAFYDFQPRQILASNLKFKTALDGCKDLEEAKGKPGVSYTSTPSNRVGDEQTNDTSFPIERSLSYEVSDEVTLTNSFETSESMEYGQSINIGLKWGGEQNPLKALTGLFTEVTTNFSFEFKEAFSTTSTTSNTETSKKGYTVSNSNPIPANTYMSTTNGLTDSTVDCDYDSPVMVSYKVAIFSITGKVYADNVSLCKHDTAGYEHGCYLGIFGGDSKQGTSATENLYLRTVDNPKSGRDDYSSALIHRYWKRNGGSNYDTTNVGVDWNEVNKDTTAKAAVTSQATRIPMMSCGASCEMTGKVVRGQLNDPVPLYLPAEFILKKGEDSYDFAPGGEMNLSDQLEIDCINKNNIPYYGYHYTDGEWVVCDPTGKKVDKSDIISISKSAAGRQTLTADKPGSAYITWKMRDGLSYQAKNESGSITAKDNLPSPIIIINVKDEPFEGSIELGGEFKGCVGDKDVNLTDYLTASVYDKNGKKVKRAVEWEARELPEDGITVEKDGSITMTKPGKFGVCAFISNLSAGTEDVRSDWYEITVSEARKLSTIKFADQEEEPQQVLLKEPANMSKVYNLPSYIRGFDQYGEPWDGSLDGVSFDVISTGKGAYISDGMLYIEDEGNFQVQALLDGAGQEEDALMSLSVSDNLEPEADQIKLQYGKTKKIKMVDYKGVAISGGLAFESNEPEIAEVSADGTVKATGVGYAEIAIRDAGGAEETVGVTVTKASQNIKATPKTIKLKANAAKKKVKAVTVKNAKGTVTYSKGKVTKPKFGKYFTVNKKTGKLTIKKGLKKGTYKVQIKVKAAGNKNYKPATKKVMVKVKVK